MTTIDASKSQLLPQLLRKLVIALTQLSSADIELQQINTKLNLSRGNLSTLNVEDLMASLDKASHLAQGYNLKEFDSNEYVAELPHVIMALKDELDNLVTEARINAKTASEIFSIANLFSKMAERK